MTSLPLILVFMIGLNMYDRISEHVQNRAHNEEIAKAKIRAIESGKVIVVAPPDVAASDPVVVP